MGENYNSAMSLCPICHQKLQKKKTALGIVHDCPNGHGRAISLYSIRRHVEKKTFRQFQSAMTAENLTTGNSCPICRKNMREFPVVFNGQKIDLDICKRCHLLWFDRGEIEKLTVVKQDEKQNHLSPEDREKIAVAEMKLIATSEKFQEDSTDEEPEEMWKVLPGLLGMPVEYGTQAFRSVPWMTWTIMGILVLVSLLTMHRLDAVVNEYGLIPNEWFRYGGLTIFTSFFLHAGLVHLFGNVYILWIFGDNVEDALGKKRFLLLLLFATLVGDFCHIALNEGSEIPTIGASGGIAGIIVCYALLFPQARLGLLFSYDEGYGWFSDDLNDWMKFPAWGGVLVWIGLQFVGAYSQIFGIEDVSYIAHLGGAAVGVGAWVFWREKIE